MARLTLTLFPLPPRRSQVKSGGVWTSCSMCMESLVSPSSSTSLLVRKSSWEIPCSGTGQRRYGDTQLWVHVGSCGAYGQLWVLMGSCGCSWVAVGAYGQLWLHIGSSGCLWAAVGACRQLWVNVDSCGVHIGSWGCTYAAGGAHRQLGVLMVSCGCT